MKIYFDWMLAFASKTEERVAFDIEIKPHLYIRNRAQSGANIHRRDDVSIEAKKSSGSLRCPSLESSV